MKTQIKDNQQNKNQKGLGAFQENRRKTDSADII